jgi:hypothetical protein
LPTAVADAIGSDKIAAVKAHVAGRVGDGDRAAASYKQ